MSVLSDEKITIYSIKTYKDANNMFIKKNGEKKTIDEIEKILERYRIIKIKICKKTKDL